MAETTSSKDGAAHDHAGTAGGHGSELPGLLGVIDEAVSRLESFMLAAGVLLMAINTVANVVGRFVLGMSIFFTEELNSILIILITFAGISYAARHGRHIRMSAIYDALPPAMRKGLMVVICALTALAMFALCYFRSPTSCRSRPRGGCCPPCRSRSTGRFSGCRSASSSPACNTP